MSNYKKTSDRDSPEQWAMRCLYKQGRVGITVTDIMREIPPDGRCPVLGIPMKFYGQQEDSATLDRIDPAGGYVVGNIAVISARANRIKSNATPEELLKIALWSAGRDGRLEGQASRLRDRGIPLAQIAKALGVSVTKAFWLSGGKRKT